LPERSARERIRLWLQSFRDPKQWGILGLIYASALLWTWAESDKPEYLLALLLTIIAALPVGLGSSLGQERTRRGDTRLAGSTSVSRPRSRRQFTRYAVFFLVLAVVSFAPLLVILVLRGP
jgi:hypothetical protein